MLSKHIKIDYLKLPIRVVSTEEITHNLMTKVGWIDTFKYGTRQDIDNGEVGILDGIRYFEKNA